MTLAIAEHEGETETELEDAYIETLGLNSGLSIKAGRFFSNIGYLNNQHTHAWDFVDAPLIYRGLFGNQLLDDGIQYLGLPQRMCIYRWVRKLAEVNVFTQAVREIREKVLGRHLWNLEAMLALAITGKQGLPIGLLK